MEHKKLLSKLTLPEKAALLSGKTVWETRDIPRLGIPSIFLADGPHGIRKQAGESDHLGLNESLKATCFPTAAAVANSWNEALGQEIGEALGEEAAAQGVHVLLGPGLNIKRSPLCGRNFEYFSEDPYLSGKMAASYIKGIQKKGVYACPKHFAVNNQELRRMAMNAVLDERTLREIYLTGFEIAVKEGGAKAIMSAYNQINGVYANEHKKLLVDILRNEWGFDGIVVTDWGASNDHVKAVACRSNLEMPSPGLDSAREILKAVRQGKLRREKLDKCVGDLLDAVVTLSAKSHQKIQYFDKKAHHRLARKAAQEGAVLLKNTNHILPLKKNTKVAVIGDFAFLPRYQGAGSSMVNAFAAESIETVISDYDLQVVGMARGYRRDGEEDAALRKEALDAAKQADVVLYFFGLDEMGESEGMDRNHMRIPQNQIDLLGALHQVNENIVGVLSAGSAIEMPWHVNLKAILHGYLGGQAGAGAMLDILVGNVNPSGRLNETYPIRYEDTPAAKTFPGMERNSEYRESIYVGYRYYDTAGVRVLYPFGYGLSYTEFSYSGLIVTPDGIRVTITNTGGMDGAEVVQMYVGLPDAAVFRPTKELKGFRKLYLKAGESREVDIPFDDKTFRYWNVKTNCWETERGTYHIYVGASVADIRLEDTVTIGGTAAECPYNRMLLPFYYTGLVQMVGDAEFETLLGHPIPSGKWADDLGINDALCQMYYAKSRLARLLWKWLDNAKKKSEEQGMPNMNLLFIYNMPFRAMAKLTNGAVSMEMVHGIVDAVNGHFWKGLSRVVSGHFRNWRQNLAYECQLSKRRRKKKLD